MTNSFVLHAVSKPSRKIAFCVCPCNSLGHTNLCHWLKGVCGAGGGVESSVLPGCPFTDEPFKKIKYPGILPLVLSKSFVIHEEIYRLIILQSSVYPGSILIYRQRVF